MPTPYALSSDLVSAWPAKSLAVAQYVDGYKLDTGPVQNAQTGTSYTFLLTDTTKTVTASNAAASTYTVPPQSAVVWEDYTTLRLLNLGAGVVTLVGGSGVTLNGTTTVAQYSSATLVRTASNTWTIAGGGTAPGMVLVNPSSVSGSGVTLSGGQVTFTAATAITINGVFTAAYDNYMIVSRLKSASNDQLQGRFVLSGTAAATNYQSQYIESYSTTTVSTAYGVSTYMSIGQVGASFNNLLTAIVSGPALASDTALISQCAYMQSAGALRGYQGWGVHTTATAYDGFFMKTNADQALTGTFRIYGLRNS